MVLTVMKMMINDQTYYGDDVLTPAEANRISFRKSGLPITLSVNQKKMLIIYAFFLKSFIPKVFSRPEKHMTSLIVSNLSRL